MNYKFDATKFKLGMRTVKTGLSVFLILLLFGLLGWEGMQIGALTAVFSLREDFDKSLSFGASRILGNAIGGTLALVYVLVNSFFNHEFLVTLFLIPILTMLTIMLNVAFNNKAGIIGGVAALLIITLSVPFEHSISYVFARVFETFIGVFVAILVNADLNLLKQMWEKYHK